MLKSLKKCLKVPIVIKPFDKYDGFGNKTFKESVNTVCHPLYETTVLRNKAGIEVVSALQLFISNLVNAEGAEIIVSEEDVVVFKAVNYNIKALKAYYDFKGKIDYWVVYL